MIDAKKKAFKLDYPFEFKGTVYSEFSARRPRVSDVREFYKVVDNDPFLAMQKILANLCEVDEPVISHVDVEDFKVMQEWIQDFFKADKSE